MASLCLMGLRFSSNVYTRGAPVNECIGEEDEYEDVNDDDVVNEDEVTLCECM